VLLTLLMVLGVLAALFGAAALATHDRDLLVDAPADRADVDLPVVGLQPEDVAAVRFGMALRGYRMTEVDDVLRRVASELRTKDARILELEAALIEVVEPQVTAAETFAEDPLVEETGPVPDPPRWPEPELEPEPEPEPILVPAEVHAPQPTDKAQLGTPAPEQKTQDPQHDEQPESDDQPQQYERFRQPERLRPYEQSQHDLQPEPTEQPAATEPVPAAPADLPADTPAVTSFSVPQPSAYVPVGHPDSHLPTTPHADPEPEPTAVHDPSGGSEQEPQRD
jgi:DivIVA domain-containing protein